MTTLILSLIAFYFVLWWLCLFIVLPFGTRSQLDEGHVVEGTEASAPAVFRMWPKLLATSILAAVVLALLVWGLSNPMLQRYWS